MNYRNEAERECARRAVSAVRLLLAREHDEEKGALCEVRAEVERRSVNDAEHSLALTLDCARREGACQLLERLDAELAELAVAELGLEHRPSALTRDDLPAEGVRRVG